MRVIAVMSPVQRLSSCCRKELLLSFTHVSIEEGLLTHTASSGKMIQQASLPPCGLAGSMIFQRDQVTDVPKLCVA